MAMKETRKEGPRGEKKKKKKQLMMRMTRTIKSIPRKKEIMKEGLGGVGRSYRESKPLAPTPKPR